MLVFMLTLKILLPVYKAFCSTVFCGTCADVGGPEGELLDRRIEA